MAFIQVHAHVVKLGPALYIRWIILLCLISTEVVEVQTNDRSGEFCGNRRVVTHGNETQYPRYEDSNLCKSGFERLGNE